MLMLATATVSTAETYFLEALRVVGEIWCGVVIALSALLLIRSHGGTAGPSALFRVSSKMGKGEILFSFPAILSISGAYGTSFVHLAVLSFFWIAATVLKPIELAASVIRNIQFRGTNRDLSLVGAVARVDDPDIFRIKLDPGATWVANGLLRIPRPDGCTDQALCMFKQMQGSETIGTAIRVATLNERGGEATGYAYNEADQQQSATFLRELSGAADAKLIGFTVERSQIGHIAFEVASTERLAEGEVVYCRICGEDVFYQIVGAETVEESFEQNPKGTHVVRAAQVGTYSPKDGFKKYPWLPTMNSPVFSAKSRKFDAVVLGDRDFVIGKLPSTGIEVPANIDDIVEYHTAVLGVTGTGKTEVALDIVKEAVGRGIKCFCVDFTGDYKARLDDLDPVFPTPDRAEAGKVEKLLAFVDAYGFKAGDEKKKLGEALTAIRKRTTETVTKFLEHADQKLAIFELAEISNSKTGLRITEIFLSAIMNWARAHRGERKVLICLEEAHTIVPEAFGSGFDGETKWVVERIGQIALQGRKYGVGLLVVTQRTALVSKTILSQCNTFLAHSLIDQTSLNFLESVFSDQQAKLIPNLGRFEFLATGKAIRSERPLLIRRDFDQAKLDASLAVRDFKPPVPAEEIPEVAAEEPQPDEPQGPRVRRL